MAWKILARNKWVSGATITESIDNESEYVRRFTATVRGWRNFKIYEGDIRNVDVNQVIEKVREIKNRIDSGDEKVFHESTMIN